MDKNMIHIDDFVRQRLNGEEEERAGAWLRMKDLLDKNIPGNTAPAAAFNWRRMLTYAAVATGIGIASVGGYEYSSKFRNVASGDALVAANSPVFVSNTPTTANVPATKANPGKVANTGAGSNQPVGIAAAANTPDVISSEKTQPADNIRPKAGLIAGDDALAGAKTINTNAQSTGAAGNAIAPNDPIAITTTAPASNNSNSNTLASNTSAANTTTANPTALNQPERTVPQRAAADHMTTGPAENTVATPGQKTKTMPLITTTQRTTIDRNGNVTVNTQETGRGFAEIPVAETLQPAQPVVAKEVKQREQAITASTEMVPAASFIGPLPDMNAGNNYVHAGSSSGSETKNTVASSRKGGGWNFQAFREMLNNATEHIGNMPVNTGFVGGINTTFGNYRFLGIQAGFYSEFVFHENWAARIEGRYMHNFNNSGNSYKNNYTSYKMDPDGFYSQYANSQEFKYSTVSSLSFPVMLQYSKDKLAFFAGANMSYIFTTNPEYIPREEPIATGLASAPQTSGTPLALSDFGTRFGLGYVFGGGYKINDLMRIDLRVTQSVWDNAKGTNSQRISKDVFKTPGAQINFSYSFGKNKKD